MKTRIRPITNARWTALSLGLSLLLIGCEKTGELSPELNSRFEKEGIVRRADDLTFRRTNLADSARETKRASIIVTPASVFLHVNGKPLVEITLRSTGYYEVHQDHDRVSLRAGGGKSAASWSFHPPDNAAGWAADIRSVIRKGKSR